MTTLQLIKAKWMAVAPIITHERAIDNIIEEWGQFMFWIGAEGWVEYDGPDRFIQPKTNTLITIEELYEEYSAYAAKHEML